MARYLLITAASPFPEEELTRLKELYPDHIKITENSWAIRAPGATSTTKTVQQSVFPPNDQGRGPRMVVVRFDAYSGYHEPAVWEWLGKPDE